MNSRLTRTLASVTFALAVLCGLAFIGTAVTHMLDDGAVCVQTHFWRNASLADNLPIGKGVKASSSAARLCQDSPSAGQRAADLGGELPWLLFGSLALLLFSRLLKAVQQQGPFTEAVAQRLSTLGWLVALGTPLAGLVVGWSQSWLVGSMAPVAGSGPAVSGPLVLLLAGLAAVIMGKIMREGVRMREDLEGTI
ncbi:protein TPRXL [Streptomyces sp. NRRL B-1568]|nr:protein TPRXL [Streptomyces sp. NRRL B-1568]